MNEEMQLEFLKDILRDLCANIDIMYDDFSSLKSHVILSMEMVFEDINHDLIDYNISKLLNFKYEFNKF